MGAVEWTEYEPTERDLLLERLRSGEIAPQAAEDEAKRRGIGPLERRPGPGAHDPMQKSRWSLHMALVWIIWRNADRVREADNEYRRECWEFEPHHYKVSNGNGELTTLAGYHLAQPEPANSIRLMVACAIAEVSRDRVFATSNEATRQLWEALQDNVLVAEGIVIVTPGVNYVDSAFIRGLKSGAFESPIGVVEIPARDWPHLVFAEDNRGKEYLGTRGPLIGVKRYESVLLKRDEILRRWPPAGDGVRRGAKPKFDWDIIESEALRLMDFHGDFDPSDPEWRVQADLERALKVFCDQRWQREPADGTLRPKLSGWLREWRKRKVGK